MKRKTVTVPDEPLRLRDRLPVFSWGSSSEPSRVPYVPELRDPAVPVAYDEQGRPLYAPRGIVLRLW